MRWFVEVSRVGENSSDEKYCVEAKQWQAALQEARKLRGDSGPLSKFSIELLDDAPGAGKAQLKSTGNRVLLDDTTGATEIEIKAGSGIGVTIRMTAEPQPMLSITIGATHTIQVSDSGITP